MVPPDVHCGAPIAQHAVIPVRAVAAVQRSRRAGELAGPGSADGDLAHQQLRRLGETVRDLHGEAAARCELGEQLGDQRHVVRHPLQRCIGQDHVEGPGIAPGRDVFDLEGDGGEARPRRLDHFARAVHADDGGLREAPLQQLGGIAGATADVGGTSHRSVGELRDQVLDRTAPLVLELAVLGGRPAHRRAPLSLGRALCGRWTWHATAGSRGRRQRMLSIITPDGRIRGTGKQSHAIAR